jgi:hypothetical protein
MSIPGPNDGMGPVEDSAKKHPVMDRNTNTSSCPGRVLRALSTPLFTPEFDEKRFLAGLPVTIAVVLFLWGKGWWLDSLKPNPVLLLFVAWWLAYLVKFWKRLIHRGQLKHALFLPALFVALIVLISCIAAGRL